MKKMKRALRLLIFVSLIILASIGIGLCGGVPIPFSRKGRETEREKIELIEQGDQKSDGEEYQVKG